MSGSIGKILFYHYYGRLKGENLANESSDKFLYEIIDKINLGFNLPTYSSGVFGVAWGFDLLNEEKFIRIEENLFFNEFDNFLDKTLNLHFDSNNFDFLHGYIGLGMYILKRYDNTHSVEQKYFYSKKIKEIINKLEKSAKKTSRFVYWPSIINEEKNLSGIDLGLAHGMPSIVNFLSRLVLYPEFEIKSKNLLLKASNFILNERQFHNNLSIFPNWTYKNKKKHSSRLAWCYGDLGIGLSLWHTSKALKNKELTQEALVILKKSTKRKNIEKNLVRDAGLCHGAMGITLIFDHLFKETKAEEFKDAAEYWLITGLEMAYHKEGHAGFMSRQYLDGKWIWKKETNLLNGVSGIGLAILSYLSPTPLKWSQCLMIS